MKQNTKHKNAFLIVFILAVLSGGAASASGQLKGLFLGVFLTYFAYLMVIKWFPKENKKYPYKK